MVEPRTNTPPATTPARPRERLTASRLFWPVLALLLLLLYNAVFTPGFMQVHVRDGHLFGSLIDILNRGAPVVLLSLGMTLVLATGGVDLSVGAVMAIAGALAAVLLTQFHATLAVIVVGALAVALVSGLWNGALVAFLEIQPIVATLILMVSGRGIAQLLTNGQILTFRDPGMAYIANGFLFGLPFPITIIVLAFLAVYLLVRGTALGLFIEAVGINERASRIAGINPRAVKLFVYSVCGVMAGLAGLIAVSNIQGADSNNVGLYLELDAILAAVIGGTALTGGRFSLPGSIVGALIIQTLNITILAQNVPVQYTLVVKAIVVLIVCLLQSEEFRRALLARFRRTSA